MNQRTSIVLAIMAAPLVARADVEVGATGGLHWFSTRNELGVADVPQAPSLNNSTLLGVRAGWFFTPMFGVEGEFGILSTTARSLEYDVTALTYRAHLVAQLRVWRGLYPFVVAGAGAFSIVSTDSEGNDPARTIHEDTDPALYAGVGLKYRFGDFWGVRLDGRALLVPSHVNGSPPSDDTINAAPDFEALASVYVRFGGHAHAAPPPAPVAVVDDDPDQDSIHGAADRCPAEAEDKDGFEDDDGCPDADNDKDGVADATDKCPSEAEDKDGFEDDDGCPDADNDKDGIADSPDRCPSDPEDKDGFEDEDGCPDADNDSDGALDASDKCPTEAETRNGFQDSDGCPDEVPAKLQAVLGPIPGVQFRGRSGDLVKTSNRALDKVAALLAEFPDVQIEVQGHTDEGVDVSEARATAVRAYLVTKGIAAERLVAKGYGDSAPAVDPTGLTGAKLKAARAKNRRIELRLPAP